MPKLIAAAGQATGARATSRPTFLDKGLSAYLVVDRDTAARFGITAATIDNALYDSFGQRIISTIFTQSNQYRVILEADPKLQNSVASLNDIYLPSAGGGQVPLSAIAQVEQRTVPLEIDHLGQFPSATISFDVAPGYSLGAAVDAVAAGGSRCRHCRPASPPSSRARRWPSSRALGNEVLLILAAIVTVYIVLGVLYESFIHPVTILSTLPSAGVGALLALIITGHDLNIVSIIGIILLIGIVKKNAIMMIDFALEAERNEGKSPRRGDPPGGAAALPPHPDDHGGGAVRRPAADAGLRHGLGTAPSAGHFHRRRPAGQPAADAVHHAGDLYLFRPAGPATCAHGAPAAAAGHAGAEPEPAA